MAPRDMEETKEATQTAPEDAQYLYVIRHGDRWDYAFPKSEWCEETSRRGDPPLSALGHKQGAETGALLDSLLHQDGIMAENITWLSSPFLRTLQTSDAMLNAFQNIESAENVKINPECSVWEMDGHNGKQHASLPPVEERLNYFPRLNVEHESLFTPALPEPRDGCLPRCDRAIKALNTRYSYKPRSAIVIVTHAAACIGLTRAASNLTLQDINPAGPCALFKLWRTDNAATWNVDHFSNPDGYNGHLGHLTEMGATTYPWNHFGPKYTDQYYTGPPESPLLPYCKPIQYK